MPRRATASPRRSPWRPCCRPAAATISPCPNEGEPAEIAIQRRRPAERHRRRGAGRFARGRGDRPLRRSGRRRLGDVVRRRRRQCGPGRERHRGQRPGRHAPDPGAAAEHVLHDRGGDGVSEPATFTSTGLAARLILTSVLPAIAVSGVPLSPQPALQLQDADGTPIAREGVIVTVQIASGGGSLTGATSATSDAEGAVVFTDLGIRGSPGTRRLIFAADAFAPATTPPDRHRCRRARVHRARGR